MYEFVESISIISHLPTINTFYIKGIRSLRLMGFSICAILLMVVVSLICGTVIVMGT